MEQSIHPFRYMLDRQSFAINNHKLQVCKCVPFLACDSIICYSALYAIARPSVCHTGGSVKKD